MLQNIFKSYFSSKDAWFQVLKIFISFILLGLVANILVNHYAEKMILNRMIFENDLPKLESQFSGCIQQYQDMGFEFHQDSLAILAYHNNYARLKTEKQRFELYRNIFSKIRDVPTRPFITNDAQCSTLLLSRIENITQMLNITPNKLKSVTRMLNYQDTFWVNSLDQIMTLYDRVNFNKVDVANLKMLPYRVQFERYGKVTYKNSLIWAKEYELLSQEAYKSANLQSNAFLSLMKVFTQSINHRFF